MAVSLDCLFGSPADGDDLAIWMPWPATSVTVRPPDAGIIHAGRGGDGARLAGQGQDVSRELPPTRAAQASEDGRRASQPRAAGPDGRGHDSRLRDRRRTGRSQAPCSMKVSRNAVCTSAPSPSPPAKYPSIVP